MDYECTGAHRRGAGCQRSGTSESGSSSVKPPTGIRRAALLTGALLTGLIPQGKVATQAVREALDDRRIASAWQALRTVNCERCHGKDYEGLAAPSIVDYARTQSRKAFVRNGARRRPGSGCAGLP